MKLPLDLSFGIDPEKPTIPGCYLVYQHGVFFPVTLCWNGIDGYWRRGALQVQVDCWAGPLPGREAITLALGKDINSKKARW